MNKRPYSLEAVILGRNDVYEPNWTANLFRAIAYNRKLLESGPVDYRVAFVEWNPPKGKPLLAPRLVKRFPFLRAIVIDAAVHEHLCEADDLDMMLNFSFNAGLRTSTADFCMITSGDLFFSTALAGYLSGVGLSDNCLFRAERVNIRNDIDFARATPRTIEDPANIVGVNSCTEPPYDVPPYTNACGDFLLVNRVTMAGLRGFDESIRHARLHLDSRFCATAMAGGLHANLIGQIFHIQHANSFDSRPDDYPGQAYDFRANLPYLNPTSWELGDHHWTQKGERLWKVSRPTKRTPASPPPATLSKDEGRAADAVTSKVLAAHVRNRRSDGAIEETRLPLKGFAAYDYWEGASVKNGKASIQVTTSPGQWTFAAHAHLPPLTRKDGRAYWLVVDAQAVAGKPTIALLHDWQRMLQEVTFEEGDRKRIAMALPEDAASVVVRNAAFAPSRLRVFGAAIESTAISDFDPAPFLLYP